MTSSGNLFQIFIEEPPQSWGNAHLMRNYLGQYKTATPLGSSTHPASPAVNIFCALAVLVTSVMQPCARRELGACTRALQPSQPRSKKLVKTCPRLHVPRRIFSLWTVVPPCLITNCFRKSPHRFKSGLLCGKIVLTNTGPELPWGHRTSWVTLSICAIISINCATLSVLQSLSLSLNHAIYLVHF